MAEKHSSYSIRNRRDNREKSHGSSHGHVHEPLPPKFPNEKSKRIDKEWIESVMKRFETDRTIYRIIDYETEPAIPAGDNFTSTLERWKVKLVLGSGKVETRRYIVKVLPKSAVSKHFISSYFLLQKEIKVYEYVFRNIEDVMSAHNDKKDKLWCDLIGYRPYDTIILQDLTELNYRVPKRTDFLDFEHCILATRGLARFHALSKVVVYDNIVDKSSFGPYQLVFDPKSVEAFMEGGVIGLYKGMRNTWGPEWAHIAERVRKVSESVEKRLIALATIDNESNNVINHGDLWLCNILFKYDDYKNMPISVKFIDFQLSHYNSFAWDLTFLLYTSVTPAFRRQHFTAIYDAYFETLIRTLHFYNYSGRYPKREAIDLEMNRLKFLGFVTLCTMYALSLADIEEPFNVEVFGDHPDPKSGFKPEIFESEVYKNTVQQDLSLFFAEGII